MKSVKTSQKFEHEVAPREALTGFLELPGVGSIRLDFLITNFTQRPFWEKCKGIRKRERLSPWNLYACLKDRSLLNDERRSALFCAGT